MVIKLTLTLIWLGLLDEYNTDDSEEQEVSDEEHSEVDSDVESEEENGAKEQKTESKSGLPSMDELFDKVSGFFKETKERKERKW